MRSKSVFWMVFLMTALLVFITPKLTLSQNSPVIQQMQHGSTTQPAVQLQPAPSADMSGMNMTQKKTWTWLDNILVTWFVLTALSVVYVAWDALTNNPELTVMKWGWLLVTLYTGLIGAALYILSCKEPAPGQHEEFIKPLWKQTLGSTIHCLAGDATGIIVAAVITTTLGLPMWLDIISEYFFGFAFGLLIFQALFMKDMLGVLSNGNIKKSLVKSFSIPVGTTGKVNAQLRNIVNDIVGVASQIECSISIENLDFKDKKAALRHSSSKKYNRMLSGFIYSKFKEFLVVCSEKKGIRVNLTNPALTSTIGLFKYTKLYGLSSGFAAALVIGRRALGFNEALNADSKVLLSSFSFKEIIPRAKSKNWKLWNKVHKKMK